jgi:hypothetical protein
VKYAEQCQQSLKLACVGPVPLAKPILLAVIGKGFVLIRPIRQTVQLPPIPRKAKAEGWYLYRCTCCGAVRRRWIERGEFESRE